MSDPHLSETSHAQSAPRFVWPPRAPIEVPAPSQSRTIESEPPAAQSAPQPAPSPALDKPSRSRPTKAKPEPRPRSWLAQIEHTWLDTIAPPLYERMRIEGWVPDAASDYCHTCGESIAAIDAAPKPADVRCPACRNARLPWERVVRLGEYEYPLKQWIHEVKFTRWRRLGRDLGRLLGDAAAADLAAVRSRDAGALPPGPPLIVPAPMPWVRRMIRGVDHTRIIAEGVADRLGGRVVQPLVRENRPSQLEVAPSRRAANIAGAIHPKAIWRRPDLSGRLVIVVDDVTTSGATLKAVCRAIGNCGLFGERPRIWAAVLARTPVGEPETPVT